MQLVKSRCAQLGIGCAPKSNMSGIFIRRWPFVKTQTYREHFMCWQCSCKQRMPRIASHHRTLGRGFQRERLSNTLISDFQASELWAINFCCWQATKSTVFCYSSPNRPRHQVTLINTAEPVSHFTIKKTEQDWTWCKLELKISTFDHRKCLF